MYPFPFPSPPLRKQKKELSRIKTPLGLANALAIGKFRLLPRYLPKSVAALHFFVLKSVSRTHFSEHKSVFAGKTIKKRIKNQAKTF